MNPGLIGRPDMNEVWLVELARQFCFVGAVAFILSMNNPKTLVMCLISALVCTPSFFSPQSLKCSHTCYLVSCSAEHMVAVHRSSGRTSWSRVPHYRNVVPYTVDLNISYEVLVCNVSGIRRTAKKWTLATKCACGGIWLNPLRIY